MTDNDARPLVSVHIPVFNGERTIHTALTSLFVQSHDNWEAIVINDGSTDRTREILESYQDSRIRIINLHRNRGRAYARQVALDNSVGDFIAYLDCDDFYHPKKLERQLVYFSEHPDSSYCGCGFGSLDKQGELRRVRSKKRIRLQKFCLGDPFPFAPVASMIRSDLAHSGTYDQFLRLAEDIDYLQRILDGKLYGAISDVLYFYHEYESITKRKIAATYVYELRSAGKFLPSRPAFAAKRVCGTTLKLLTLSTVGMFLPLNKIVDRRGAAPTQRDRALLEKARQEIGSNGNFHTIDAQL